MLQILLRALDASVAGQVAEIWAIRSAARMHKFVRHDHE
jgi:hypothetical protein